jgi:hypothetical protein
MGGDCSRLAPPLFLFLGEVGGDVAIDVGDAQKSSEVLSSLVLTAVEQSGSWRVELAWPKHTKRYFGNLVLGRKLRNGLKNIADLPSGQRSQMMPREKRMVANRSRLPTMALITLAKRAQWVH